MKPAILSVERTAVLAVWSDVVLFDNMAHFVMFVKCQNMCVYVCMYACAEAQVFRKVSREMAKSDYEDEEQQPISIMAAKAGRIGQLEFRQPIATYLAHLSDPQGH